jgi:hypothetical protein
MKDKCSNCKFFYDGNSEEDDGTVFFCCYFPKMELISIERLPCKYFTPKKGCCMSSLLRVM